MYKYAYLHYGGPFVFYYVDFLFFYCYSSTACGRELYKLSNAVQCRAMYGGSDRNGQHRQEAARGALIHERRSTNIW